MSLDLDHPGLARERARSSPYLAAALERAGERALRLHSETVGIEHLLLELLADEESALHRAVVHAFADPDTIAGDVLALAPGILVVGSDAALPFSTRALAAVRAARARAVARGATEVGARDLLVEAVRALPGDARAALEAAGYRAPEPAAPPPAAGAAPSAISSGANPFHHFSAAARRALARANRAAGRAGEPSIGPARVAAGALGTEPDLDVSCGFTARRLELALEGRTVDALPPPARRIPPDDELLRLLSDLPDGASSIALVELVQRGPGSELAQAFSRQKVTPELLERARGAFADP